MAEKFKSVNEDFVQNNERHSKHVQAWNEKNKEIGDRITNADANIANIMVTLAENKQERQELFETNKQQRKDIDGNCYKANEELKNVQKAILEKMKYFENET